MGIDQRTIRKSFSRLILSGNVFELYKYERPYIYNFPPMLRNFSGELGGPVQVGRREDNLSRVRHKITRLINSNINQYGYSTKFITFTFRDNVTELHRASIAWQGFARRAKEAFGRSLKYLTVVEFQKRGAVHYHTLFFNLPSKKNLARTIEKLWGEGFIKVKSVGRVSNSAGYLCKYLTKEAIDTRLKGEKAYFASKGLIQPVEFRREENIAIELERAIMVESVVKFYETTSYGRITYMTGKLLS